jgi:hypothetical protein
MKKTKLFVFILIGIITFNACSSDKNNSENNPIIGTWKPIKKVEICSTGSIETYDYHECEKTGRTKFFSNGTVNITEYDLNNGNCEQFDNANGSWRENNGILTLTFDGFSYSPNFYELNNDTLKIGLLPSYSPIYCESGQLSNYYIELIKVE